MTAQASPLKDAATAYLHDCESLDCVLAKWRSFVLPAPDKATWITVNGGWLFPDPAGEERIRIKQGKLGIAFYWKDGRREHAVFDIRDLWDEMTNPRPQQLELWAMV